MKKKIIIIITLIAIGSIGFMTSHRTSFDVKSTHNDVYGDFTISDGQYWYTNRNSSIINCLYDTELDKQRERTADLDRMRRLWQAKLQYEHEHGEPLPDAIRDADGRKLLSWRVLLLPYLGEQEYYDDLHLDRPWYSEDNFYAAIRANERVSKSTLNVFFYVYHFSPSTMQIDAIQLPDGRKDLILVERFFPATIEDEYVNDDSRKGNIRKRMIGGYLDPEHQVTLEQIRDGSFLKNQRKRFSRKDRRFLICCERGEFLVSIDISPKELERFILEKCCKN